MLGCWENQCKIVQFVTLYHVLQQVGNVRMMGKINVRLFNLPHFIMLKEMINF
jgi:hypothetical protein